MHRQQITAQKIDAFCGKGQSSLYRDFAMHAAVLWVFNADLLYQMRANFRQDEQGKSMPVPQEAVADLLLSSLVESLGQGWFEFDPAARELLLTEISHSPRFGKTRLDDLSDFLLQYLDRRPNAKGLENGVFAEMLHWNALMHVRPQEAAERIGLALREGSEQKNAFQPIRIQQIYEKIMLPVRHQPQFKNLELYIDGAAQLALERRGAAAKAFDQVDAAEMQFGKITLHVPKLKPIKTKFELPSGILHAAMSADGKWIAAGMYNGSVALVNLISGEITYKELSKSDVNSVRLKDNKLLVACLDGQVYVFDWTKEEWEQLFYHRFEEAVWTAEFDAEGERFLLGLSTGQIEVRSIYKTHLTKPISAHKNDVMEAQFIPGEDICVSVGLDGKMAFYTLEEGKQISFFKADQPLWTFAFHPNQAMLVIGQGNGDFVFIRLMPATNVQTRYWNFIQRDPKGSYLNLEAESNFQAHTQSVRSIAWLPYEDHFVILSSSTDGGILVHSTEGELLHTIQPPGGEQAMCVQIVEDKIMTATGSALNIIPVQNVWAALDKGQKQETPKQEKDTVTYSEIILYVVSNVNSNTGETNFGLLKDLFNESLNSVKIDEDVYDLNVEGMALRVRLWEVLPSELQKGLHRIYMSNGSVCLFVMNGGFDQSLIKSAQTVTDNLIVIDQNMLRNIYERRATKGFDLYQVIRENLRAKEINRPEQLSSFEGSFSDSEQAKPEILMEILRKSPGFGVEVPRAWINLKLALEDEGQNVPSINLRKFEQISKDQGVDDTNAALAFLNQICVTKYFEADGIKSTVFLNIENFIRLCGILLDRDDNQCDNNGFMLIDQLPLNELFRGFLSRYKLDHPNPNPKAKLNLKSDYNRNFNSETFNLLRYFNYCFKTDDSLGWLFPDLMLEINAATLEFSQTAYPTRVFQYEQFIKNIHYQIFSQFFTSLKPDSLSQSGAVFTKGKAQVAVIIDKTAHAISLLIDGPGSGALRQEIEAKIEETNSAEQLTVVKNVPCICPQCLSDKKPTLYPYNNLIDFQSKGETNVQCTKSRALVAIQDLLALEPAKIRIQTLIETYTKISNADEKRMLELLEGKDDSARMAWLEKGLVAYNAVGQVIGNNSSIGTGFLLADRTVLTCNHVVKKEDLEKGATIKFTALGQPDQIFTYNLALEGFEYSPTEALNFSKIQVHDLEAKPLSSWGHLPSFNMNPVKNGEPVFIIRYHQGKIKEIDFKPSVAIDASTDFIYYTFHEGSKGSSGGPILNANWDCIGMHEGARDGVAIGNTGRKETVRKGTLLKVILKPDTDEEQPEAEQSPIMAEIEFIQDLVAQSDLDSALKALTALDEKFQVGVKNDIIFLSANIKRIQKMYADEILNERDYSIIHAQNTNRLLDLLNEIPKKVELNQAAQKQSTDIRRKIKK